MEIVDKFDNKRRPLNKTSERYDEIEGEYKQSMHVWIQNDKGEFLIQKRSSNKRSYPGKWSITGGGVDTGESTLDTVIRECKEELGIDAKIENLELMMTLKRTNSFVDIYLLKQNIEIEDIIMQEEEVDDVKWISISDLKKLMNTEEFCSAVSIYFDMLYKIIEKKL